jgi:hypothetical protein
MTRIAGLCRGERDGVVYSYDVAWKASRYDIDWSARVRRDGELVALPSGSIQIRSPHSAGSDLISGVVADIRRRLGLELGHLMAVKAEVEAAVERRSALAEVP